MSQELLHATKFHQVKRYFNFHVLLKDITFSFACYNTCTHEETLALRTVILSKRYTLVLASAGIELIVFLVAGTVLCFGFSVRITLITH